MCQIVRSAPPPVRHAAEAETKYEDEADEEETAGEEIVPGETEDNVNEETEENANAMDG